MFKTAEEIIPDPESLLESVRSIGYSVKEAISDLIDNSISANATKINVVFEMNESLEFHLIDNGEGMSYEELVSAFRLGSTNPKTTRKENDLGRFGMGMKTASLSQCRAVTVTSKQNGQVYSRTLDLDEVSVHKKWIIGEKEIHPNITDFLEKIDSGTIVSWEKIDDSDISEEEFDHLLLEIRDYISLCFHRFMERSKDSIEFALNGLNIEPVSPIVTDSQIFSEISLDGVDSKMKAYTIPIRKENQSEALFNSFELFNGVESQQGIYIYRSDRLLCFGGWLGIVRPNNSYKLCRVIIDFKNDYSSDTIWSIDIKKTKATIPYAYRQEIKRFVKKAQLDSSRKIGKYNKKELIKANAKLYDNVELWTVKKNKTYGFWEYNLNIDNPLFTPLLEKVKETDLQLILDIVTRNLPIADIIDNNDEEPANHDTLYALVDLEDVLQKEKRAAKLALHNAIKLGMTKKEAMDYILAVEPFMMHKTELKDYLNDA
ncbi:MAG: ATP-binding protein [Jejuia sp.]